MNDINQLRNGNLTKLVFLLKTACMKSLWLWILAIILAVSVMVYQRMTGPTTPVRGSVEYLGETVKYKMLRTWGGSDGARIEVKTNHPDAAGVVQYRRFRSNDEWKVLVLKNDNGLLSAQLPALPPAGKMMYQVFLFERNNHVALTEDPIVLRYKGEVPIWVLIPHVLFMVLSMVFCIRAGLEAIKRRKQLVSLTFWSMLTLLIGGLILGPIVQKYAFDAYWTGWPFGHDLTDNKTAVSLILWVVAYFIIRRNPQKRGWVLAACILQLAVYLIPHSVLGSEIDFTQPQYHQP